MLFGQAMVAMQKKAPAQMAFEGAVAMGDRDMADAIYAKDSSVYTPSAKVLYGLKFSKQEPRKNFSMGGGIILKGDTAEARLNSKEMEPIAVNAAKAVSKKEWNDWAAKIAAKV